MGAAGQQGVYVASVSDPALPTPPPVKVADLTMAIPQGQGTFTGFVALSASGAHTAFLATGTGGQKGLYLASALTKIIDLTDTLDGKAITDLRFGADGLSGNNLVFTAVFADGSEGVYHVTVDFPGVNDAPAAADDAYTSSEDEALVVAAPGLLGNDEDPEGSPLIASLVSGPVHGAVSLHADGSFTYGPVSNFNGTDRFTYTVTDPDGAESAVATVTITVTPVNDPPLALGDSYRTRRGTTLTVAAPGVLSNDGDVDSPSLAAILVAGPSNGTVSLAGDGSFTYTPNPTFVGVDSFQYKATDGAEESGVATVALTVEQTSGPIARNDSYIALKNLPRLVLAPGVLGNDASPTGARLTAVVVRQPSHGVVLLLPNGAFLYFPFPNFVGTDAFLYKASDGVSTSNVATVTIKVVATP
jgi:VCBS repeat-containing protein